MWIADPDHGVETFDKEDFVTNDHYTLAFLKYARVAVLVIVVVILGLTLVIHLEYLFMQVKKWWNNRRCRYDN